MDKLVYLVDDDEAIGEVVKEILQASGYNFKACTSYSELSKNIELQLPDVILLDIALSGKSGIEIAKILRRNNKTKNIPLIIVSASPSIRENLSSESYVDDYLEKPFEIEQLLSIIKKYT